MKKTAVERNKSNNGITLVLTAIIVVIAPNNNNRYCLEQWDIHTAFVSGTRLSGRSRVSSADSSRVRGLYKILLGSSGRSTNETRETVEVSGSAGGLVTATGRDEKAATRREARRDDATRCDTARRASPGPVEPGDGTGGGVGAARSPSLECYQPSGPGSCGS